jgi:hypothetical protein
MKLVIKRSEWIRGEGSEHSLLFRPADGKRCCLGFLGNACGVKDLDQVEPTPAEVGAPFPEWLYEPGKGTYNKAGSKGGKTPYRNTTIGHRLMELNDNRVIDDYEREEKLIAEFAKVGVEVTFVD